MRRLAFAALLLQGCAAAPGGEELVADDWAPSWLVEQLDASGLHSHPHGDPVWVGHEVEELIDSLGEPDFMLETPRGDVAYCYRRNERDALGRLCIDAYVINEYDMVAAVYCRD